MLILSSETVVNRAALQIRKIPTRRLGRGFQVVPKGLLASGLFWRVLLDQSLPRYLLALAPFPLAMALRPDLALAISQAPLLMFAVVYGVESQILTVTTPSKRKKLLPEDEVARRLDRFRLGAREALTRIAATRQIQSATLHLVVEQSPLRHVPLLTVVSVQVLPDATAQTDTAAGPYQLDLTAAERAILDTHLFAHLSEADLHLANTVQNTFLRDEPLQATAVSAHARLLAMARPA